VADPLRIQGFLQGFALTAPTAEQVLGGMVACAPGQIRTVACASQAGAGGATATIIDVRKNGTSVYTNPANRPTLAAGQTGRFTSILPNRRDIKAGDIVTVVCAQAGGHPSIFATVALEEP
jgi:hypothetical protein